MSENSKLLVYPNPAKSTVSIKLSNNTKIEKVEIYSILGEKIITKKSEKDTVNINVSDLASGVYFIKTQTITKELFSKKLIVK